MLYKLFLFWMLIPFNMRLVNEISLTTKIKARRKRFQQINILLGVKFFYRFYQTVN